MNDHSVHWKIGFQQFWLRTQKQQIQSSCWILQSQIIDYSDIDKFAQAKARKVKL